MRAMENQLTFLCCGRAAVRSSTRLIDGLSEDVGKCGSAFPGRRSGGAASLLFWRGLTVSRRLTAMCCGIAAKVASIDSLSSNSR
jgi:hypothetical protein